MMINSRLRLRSVAVPSVCFNCAQESGVSDSTHTCVLGLAKMGNGGGWPAPLYMPNIGLAAALASSALLTLLGMAAVGGAALKLLGTGGGTAAFTVTAGVRLGGALLIPNGLCIAAAAKGNAGGAVTVCLTAKVGRKDDWPGVALHCGTGGGGGAVILSAGGGIVFTTRST